MTTLGRGPGAKRLAGHRVTRSGIPKRIRMPEARKAARKPKAWTYPYEPFPKQGLAHRTYADEVLFGGAAGPGKTDWLIAEALILALEIPGAAVGLFRRTLADLERPRSIIPRLLARIPRRVGVYNGNKYQWRFVNGSVLALGYLQHDKDVQNYQGAEFDLIGIDQVEQFEEWQYRFLTSRLRAAGPVAEALEAKGFRPRILNTANPGGPGHAWVKARWIEPAPPGVTWQPEPTEDEPEPGTRVFIPGKHTDNPALDQSYRRRLRNLPPDLRRALEEGDWDVFIGQRFRHFRRDTHVIAPERFRVPLGGVAKGVGVDYGLEAPFVALWGAMMPGDILVVYRELDGSGLTPAQQAQGILKAELPGERRPQRPIPVALDPSTWARQPNAPGLQDAKGHAQPDDRPPVGSIAGDYYDAGVPVERANNARVRGWALIDDLLRVRHVGHEDPTIPGNPWTPCSPYCLPRLLIYSTCVNLIRTLPGLVRDKRKPEDVDTHGEDHWGDALRYLASLLIDHPVLPPGADPGPGGERPDRDAGRRHVTGSSIIGNIRRKGF